MMGHLCPGRVPITCLARILGWSIPSFEELFLGFCRSIMLKVCSRIVMKCWWPSFEHWFSTLYIWNQYAQRCRAWITHLRTLRTLWGSSTLPAIAWACSITSFVVIVYLVFGTFNECISSWTLSFTTDSLADFLAFPLSRRCLFGVLFGNEELSTGAAPFIRGLVATSYCCLR